METKGDKMENRILVSIAFWIAATFAHCYVPNASSIRFLLHVDYLYLLQKFQQRLILISTTLTCNPLKARSCPRYNTFFSSLFIFTLIWPIHSCILAYLVNNGQGIFLPHPRGVEPNLRLPDHCHSHCN